MGYIAIGHIVPFLDLEKRLPDTLLKWGTQQVKVELSRCENFLSQLLRDSLIFLPCELRAEPPPLVIVQEIGFLVFSLFRIGKAITYELTFVTHEERETEGRFNIAVRESLWTIEEVFGGLVGNLHRLR